MIFNTPLFPLIRYICFSDYLRGLQKKTPQKVIYIACVAEVHKSLIVSSMKCNILDLFNHRHMANSGQGSKWNGKILVR